MTPYAERHGNEQQDINPMHVIQTFLIWEMTISIKTWDSFKENPKSIMESPPPPPRHPALNYSLWGSLLPCHGDTQAALWEAQVVRKETWASCQWPGKRTT